MILQGIFNILDIFSSEIDLFYNIIINYYNQKLVEAFGSSLNNEIQPLLNKENYDILSVIVEDLIELGFKKQKLDKKFLDEYLEILKWLKRFEMPDISENNLKYN